MPLLDPQFLGPAGSLVHFDEEAFCASASGSGWGLEGRVTHGPGWIMMPGKQSCLAEGLNQDSA